MYFTATYADVQMLIANGFDVRPSTGKYWYVHVRDHSLSAKKTDILMSVVFKTLL